MGELMVEVADRPVSGDLSRRPQVHTEKLGDRASEVGNAVIVLARELQGKLDRAEQEPGGAGRWALDQVELGFSLSLTAESGVVIARASGSATFDAKLTWTRTRNR